jgi:VIT1/CCC1 family predicted Fe2+/Mn2+ transporter
MPEQLLAPTRRVLEPHERVAEVLFGLIMVLTFTGSLSVAQAGRDDVRTMLIGALGCNLAWGIIDAVLYLMGALAEKSRDARILHAVHHSKDDAQAQQLIAAALPPSLASVVQPAELETMRRALQRLPDPPARAHLHRSDYVGAVAVFLLVFLSTFPVALPFLCTADAALAKRLSNVVALAMLFGAGAVYGRIIGRTPWLVGVVMFLLGTALAGMTMALGG